MLPSKLHEGTSKPHCPMRPFRSQEAESLAFDVGTLTWNSLIEVYLHLDSNSQQFLLDGYVRHVVIRDPVDQFVIGIYPGARGLFVNCDFKGLVFARKLFFL